jgi:hypothetical protein
MHVCLQLPSTDEIEALLAGRKLTAIVFFLDETFEEVLYDVSTTVLEAVEQLAHVIKLENYQTFTLFECRRVRFLGTQTLLPRSFYRMPHLH